MGGLFNKQSKPLAARLIPSSLDEFFGQEHLTGENGPIRIFIEKDQPVSSIFYGPPGTGKTALAKIIAQKTKSDFIRINAVTSTIEDIRAAIKRGLSNSEVGIRTILFIDEIHRYNKTQQDALLPPLEEGILILIGTTTKNPMFSLTPPLRSRVLLFEFKKLSIDALENILKKAIELENGELSISQEAKNYLINYADGDARRLLNILDAAITIKKNKNIELEDIKKIISEQWILYDHNEDYHYDVISAFIKSVRGSDPDAALYWLAVMLHGGEDPLYIARRLIILAAEDIGLADPFSLLLATSTYDAVNSIGMPEARIILAETTIYLSLQPKSNSIYNAIENSLKYVKNTPLMEVPPYLRANHPDKSLYKYPHDYPSHYVKQKYTPKPVQFYFPSDLGKENMLKKTYNRIKGLKEDEDNTRHE